MTGLKVFPTEITLTARDRSHRILVTGVTANGRQVDRTHAAQYESSDAAIASVDETGTIRGLAAGTATITAGSGGRQAAVTVKVKLPDFGAAARQISFKNEVMPVLSRAGCNMGECHAKAGGQAGFRLSVFGFDSGADYHEIVKDSRGRRIFPAAPEESLIIKKPTARVKHGGGQRLESGTESYDLVVNWLRQGAPADAPDAPTLTHLELFPASRSYAKKAAQPLLVLAEYSDGAKRDVTHLAHFETNDEDIATVDENGTVTVGTVSGESVVLTRFMGHVAVSRVTVPRETVLPAERYAALPRNNDVDEHVYAKLQTLGYLPSARTTDGEFLRRASLDAIGVLPTVEETRAFLAEADPDKRVKLIDRLLADPRYADHWAVKWGDLIRANPVRVGVKGVFMLDRWIRQSFRQNKPYDQFVREIITAKGSTHKVGPTVILRDRRSPPEILTLVGQIFLGVRMECAKCHHHPNENLSQRDFYQMAAFFGQVKRKGAGLAPPISPGEEFWYHAPGGRVTHPVSGQTMEPTPLHAAEASLKNDQDPRDALADWMTSPGNPFLARAIVNRIWSAFMGVGIVEPIDDFRTSNPPTNEPLLDALARDFVANGYDLKQVMRTIMRSYVYQLSSLPNETNAGDTKHYSRSYRRRLPAEVMLDAVCDVTGVPEKLSGMPAGTRAIQTWNHRLESFFMSAFGRPDKSSDCPCERNRSTSVAQALHLMNATALQAKLADKTGRASRLVASEKSEKEIIDELYLATYCRVPTDQELQAALSAYKIEGATRQTATEDVLWALLNSAEFVFNH